MKPYFAACTLPTIQYRTHTLVNNAVNLNLVHQLAQGRISYYPDNVGIPAINFLTVGPEGLILVCQWAFNTQEECDAELAKLLAPDVEINGGPVDIDGHIAFQMR